MKGQIYEGGHRIPLMMRWDNGPIPKGETRSHLIGLNDIYATLCQLIGVDVPDNQGIDSVGFADYIQNVQATQNLRKYLGVWRFRSGILDEESIRKNNLKLIKFHQSGQMSLYNLDTDIGETMDLIGDSSYKQDVDEMLVALEELSPCHDNKNSFKVADDKGSLQDRSCAWFEKDRKRCTDYPEGYVECRFTCGLNSALACSVQPSQSPSNDPVQPSLSPSYFLSHSHAPSSTLSMRPVASTPPTPTTSFSCNDTSLRFKLLWNGNLIMRDCIWIGNRATVQRCKLPGVPTACPVTCDACNTCEDSTVRFKVGWNSKKIMRDCTWVGNKATVQRCNIDGVAEACPATCDRCP